MTSPPPTDCQRGNPLHSAGRGANPFGCPFFLHDVPNLTLLLAFKKFLLICEKIGSALFRDDDGMCQWNFHVLPSGFRVCKLGVSLRGFFYERRKSAPLADPGYFWPFRPSTNINLHTERVLSLHFIFNPTGGVC
jgi:hypothetical protein